MRSPQAIPAVIGQIRAGESFPPGPSQLQAAIIAVHTQAARFEDTDWPQIAALYRELARWTRPR
jgi:predicted RNA polymerase sigma factor